MTSPHSARSYYHTFVTAFFEHPQAVTAAVETMVAMRQYQKARLLVTLRHAALALAQTDPVEAYHALVFGTPGLIGRNVLAESFDDNPLALATFMRHVPWLPFLELCQRSHSSHLVYSVAAMNRKLLFIKMAEAAEVLPRCQRPIPTITTVEIKDLVDIKNDLLAAITLEGLLLSATDSAGDQLRKEVSRGWRVVDMLCALFRGSDDINYTDEEVIEQIHLLSVENQVCLMRLLDCLIVNPLSALAPGADIRRKITPKMWRLWVLTVGSEPFIDAWLRKRLIEPGFLGDVEDTWVTGAAAVYQQAPLDSLEQWYVGMVSKGYQYDLAVILEMGSHPAFFDTPAYHVSKW
ncbi:hypothetical protein BDV95DRAFT_604563 [Massariosphaeria phaeospora]|uniref:Uncharacterized protein n=1 Tax=Massariosphaeria phaeospora TaxID=100035 RepID=A0A7C8MBX0_9PLEO|nr:hypothetical protein BDV95DRAFT_604563 [Massariosphaeria phaeospora]